MSRYHHDTVVSAVKYFAFPKYENLDTFTHLPFQEPPFRFVNPGEQLVKNEIEEPIFISKKPEGSREIFVGLYDNADHVFHMYTMNRNLGITYVRNTHILPTPTVLPESMEEKRRESVRSRARTAVPGTINVMFVLDVCRVMDVVSHKFINVILGDMGPIRLHSLTVQEREFLFHEFNLVEKRVRQYTDLSDLDDVMNSNENFPYIRDNGIVLVQGTDPNPRTPCAKYTPPEFASVYLHVLPVITMKTRIWKMFIYSAGKAEPYKVIPAPENFYVPPMGAIVAFKIEQKGNMWRFVPKHIREDKNTPSTLFTIQRFISRHLKINKNQQHEQD